LITFRMLGGVELRDSSGAELRSVIAQPKRLALLACLAHSPSRRFHSRDTLLGLLWPELDEARGRAALNQSVYYLRQELGPNVVVSRGGEELGIDPERLWCDAAEFERALDRDDAVGALELYRGDLLAGLFLADGVEWERWVESERSRLCDRAVDAARKLIGELESRGRITEAVHWARRALALSGNDESDLRTLIALLDRSGDRAAAVRAYEEFARVLARDYELEVSPETRELIERVRSREVAAGRQGAAAEPEPPASDPGDPVAVTASPSPAGDRQSGDRDRRRRALLLGGVFLVIVSLAAALPRLRPGDEPRVRSAPGSAGIEAGSRVAVLPFDNFGPDPGDEYLADGMTEELITRLSRVSGLRVIARTSVMPYRGAGRSVADVGRELGVGYVLEGSVRRSGDRMRIAVQLVDARTEQHLWAETYEGEVERVLDVQRKIAEAVVAALPVRPPESERRRLVERGTDNPSAHLLYLRGRHMLGRDDPVSFARARDLFERAIERDSTYARAWSGLSDAFDRLLWARVVRPAETYPRARAAAERALELDPGLAEAHISLARALTAYVWDPEGAERHFRRALALDPSNARAHQTYSSHLLNHGRFAEARAEAEAAVELDPLSFFPHFQLVLVAFFEGRNDEAIERAEALVGMGPDARNAHFMLAKARVEKGQHEAALQDLDRADPQGTFPPALAVRGYIHGKTGETAEARRTLDTLENMSLGPFVAFERAIVHLGLGENGRALELLEAAVEARDWRVRLLREEPMFAPLRSEPGYRALLARVGLET